MSNIQKRGIDLNTLTFTGRLACEPKLKQLENEKRTLAASFCVANQTFMASKTSFINCQAYGAIAKYIGDYLHKGSSVIVKGELAINSYTDKQGVHRSFTVVNVSQIVSSKSTYYNDEKTVNIDIAMDEDEFYKEYDEAELPF